MMQRRRRFMTISGAFAALLLCMVLAACAGQNAGGSSDASSGASGSAANTQAAFTQKDVPVFRQSLTDETVSLRFYEQTPNIAYIGLADYYKLLLPQGSMDVEHKDDGTYLFTSHTGADPSTNMGQGMGGTAVADPVAGTLTSPNLPAFTNMMSIAQEGMDNGYYDGAPYVRVSRMEYDKDPEPVTLDFARYGIAMHSDDQGVYLPLQTVSVIYSDLGYHYASYNGEKVYVTSDDADASMQDRDPEFSNPILSNRTRPEDLTAFSYAHLRFCIDYYDAVPSRMADMLGNHDLDATLDAMGEDGKAIKAGIVSTDAAEHYAACDALGFALDDGGHTSISHSASTSIVADKNNLLYNGFVSIFTDTTKPLGNYLTTTTKSLAVRYALKTERENLRNEAYGDETYIKKGDTAVIVFDGFTTDERAWADFFAGKGERPNAKDVIAEGSLKGKHDVVSAVSEGIARAKEDPEVTNVVLDISNNSGGSLDVLVYIASVVSGREYIVWQNSLTGQMEKECFDVDRNLDGTFDEKDDLVDYSDLHFAVLTSRSSYSCGNLLPSVLADEGIMVMGERSGGGSCAVQQCVTADGVSWTLSSWRGKLFNEAGHEIDDGVPVDVDLLERTGSKTTESGSPDYSGFYDIDLLSEVMNEHYGAEQLAKAA